MELYGLSAARRVLFAALHVGNPKKETGLEVWFTATNPVYMQLVAS